MPTTYRGQDGALVLGGLLDGSAVIGKVNGKDTFTGTNGTALNLHAPDVGLGTWALGTAGVVAIQSNKAQVASSTASLDASGVLAGTAQDNDSFELFADIVLAGAGGRAGLRFRSDSPNATGDFLVAYVYTQTTETSAQLILARYATWGPAQAESQLIQNGINLGSLWSTGIRLGVTVNGSNVKLWTEPAGGGVRTQQGNFSFSTALNDASHKNVGLFFWNDSSNVGDTFDNFTFRTGAKTGDTSVNITTAELGTLQGVVVTGDSLSFSLTGDTKVVTGGVYPVVAGAILAVALTGSLTGNLPPESSVLLVANSVGNLKAWELTANQDLLDTSAQDLTNGAAWKTFTPGQANWQATASGMLDHADAAQGALVDQVIAASPPTSALTFVFRLASGKTFYASGNVRQAQITDRTGPLVTIAFQITGSGAAVPAWT